MLSVDVDDIVVAMNDFHGTPAPSGYHKRIDYDVASTLHLLDECDCKATFFVNAQHARGGGQFLRDIVSHGHDLASHGFFHNDIRKIPLQEFRDDLRRSLDVLAQYQNRICGYRPPAFSMAYDNDHFAILLDHGIEYVSSGVGFARSNAPYINVPIKLECGLLHVPISTVFVGQRLKYPIGYGIVPQLIPSSLYMKSLDLWLKRQPFFHFYCHSFEIAGLAQLGAKSVFRDPWSTNIAKLYWLGSQRGNGLFRKVFSRCRFESIESGLRMLVSTSAN